jgi:hypothetical protein
VVQGNNPSIPTLSTVSFCTLSSVNRQAAGRLLKVIGSSPIPVATSGCSTGRASRAARQGFFPQGISFFASYPQLVNAIMQTAGRTHEGYLWVNRVAGSIPAMLVKQRVAQWIEQVVFVPKGAKTSPSAKSLSAVCFIIRCSHDYGLWVERKRLL